MQFIYCFQAEWIKRTRSLSSWLVIIGAFLTPVILLSIKLIYYDRLKAANQNPDFWNIHWKNSWESMAIFLLPLGIILSASLITQLEYKNNTWKQWHTTPQKFTTVFFAKLAVILVMMVQFFILFNIGIYLSAIIPGFLVKGVSYPVGTIPYADFFKQNMIFFAACLPIISLQYLAGLHFKNFLVSVGCGIALWILSLASLPWKFSFTIPYTYTSLYFLRNTERFKQTASIEGWAFFYFIAFTIAGYILYVTKKEKG